MPAVDASALRKQLAESWRTLGKQESGAVLRACSMTFLVMADSNEDPQELGATLAGLNHEHPSRTILLRLHENESGAIDGRVEVTCWMPAGKRQQICSEQIVLDASPDTVDQMERVILALTVPDLPVVAWCRCPGLISPTLLRLANKVIIDGRARPSGAAALRTLSRLKGSPFFVADLAWTRITRWREILYSLFLTPQFAGRAVEVREVEIASAGKETPATAVYLAGWLKRALPALRVRFRALQESSDDPRMGRLREVILTGPDFVLALRRPPGVGLDVSFDGTSAHLRFPLLNASELLREEISIVGRDAVFEDSWRQAATLLEQPS